MEFNKLVRDNIPAIIKAEGYSPKIEILNDERYLLELERKLSEEVAEYQEIKELEELADILEVIYAICIAKGHTLDELICVKEDKQLKKGSFSKRVFLVSKSKSK